MNIKVLFTATFVTTKHSDNQPKGVKLLLTKN